MNIITFMYEFGFKVLHVLKGEKEKDFFCCGSYSTVKNK